MLAKEWSQARRVFDLDLFHAHHGKAHAISVNSVSLQPFLTRTSPLEPFYPNTVVSPLASLSGNE
jgi:hypothetical protein